MLFSSLSFLFIFLPVVLILYNLSRSGTYRNFVLLLASLFFYAWGEPVIVFILMAMVIFNWLMAACIEKAHDDEKMGKRITAIAIILDLLPLVIFKLLTTAKIALPFLLNARERFPNLSLPLGISFFTFSAISYLVDVNRGEMKAERNLLLFANYMTLFPKLLQGPMTQYKAVKKDLDGPRTSVQDMAEGLRRFIIGMARKVLIADNLAAVVNRIFAQNIPDLSAGLAWYGLLAYAVQIYMDFSGYTDMAIGLGRMFGFSLPENFNFPYLSRSAADFWRRWHMTLMNFFRTYIFMPLEIARRKVKHFRQETDLLVVFLVTGFWHGITGNFILWGLYFGLVIVLESSLLSRWLKKLPKLLRVIYTLAIVLAGWVFFKLDDLADWGPFFKALLGLNQPSNYLTVRTLNILVYLPILVLGMIGSTPLFKNLYERSRENKYLSFATDAGLVGLMLLCIAATVSGSYQAFLYSEF